MDQRTPLDLAYDVVAAARQVAVAALARAGEQDRDDGFPAEDVADLARLGLLTALIPFDEGGAGLGEEPGATKLAEVLRLVGYGSLALERIYEGHVNALQLIARYGTPAQRARLFAEARAGHLFGVWNTDPPGDCLKLGDDRRLHGVKTFASGAGFVTRALVTVKREPGSSPLMLVVRLEPGCRADLGGWRAHGMRASATGTVDFEGIAVTGDEMLGGWDDYHRQPVFSGGAWRFAAVQLGGIEAVFDAWRSHLAGTGHGGDPHHLARPGEGAIALEGARSWVERAARTVYDWSAPIGVV
ncbi:MULTISPECIES: acyl-CoA dehydrogenase family protein [Methylobacterium]|uniref:Cyclic nucleotide-binding protein n=1 Tax=Methylobacterium aquaticum TaxID=270351 RepID=A0A0C6FQF3_9HYPH|nr:MULTISPECIES: acyl-CoA dehydrogenase family protein [Methylobacterium]NGM37079.1 acyl-CoA/acyl-ACP dehydrogenase [Methylobacterium sp. DB0501]BAQ49277.1 cyclic nucleotide-binding protein [Methylobacterium aquaticum]